MSGQSAEIDHFTIDPFLIIGIWNRATDNKKKKKNPIVRGGTVIERRRRNRV